MSANLMASTLLSSQATISREPHVAHSDARDQGAGFESLLADFDPPSAAPAAAESERAAASPSPRPATTTQAASAPAPHAVLTTNIDAALSMLGTTTFSPPTATPAGVKTSASTAPRNVQSATPSTRSVQPAANPSQVLPFSTTPDAGSALSSVSAPAATWLSAAKADAATPDAGAFLSALLGQANETTSAPAAKATPSTIDSASSTASATTWPSEAKANANPPDVKAFLSAVLGQANETNSGAIAKPPSAPAANALAPAPGAALGTVSYATQIALSFAPELGFQKLQTTTHLAVSSGKSAPVAVGPAPAAAPLDPAPSLAAPTQTNPRQQQSSSSNTGGGGAPKAAAGAESSVATQTVSPAVSAPTPAAAISSANADTVSLADLGELLANQAATLAQPDGGTSVKLATTPIKELKLSLDPANLGAVAINLKMTNGKLSVDVGVANPNALAAVEGQRDKMIAKLQTGAQPLESFVVHQQIFTSPSLPQSAPNPSLAESFGNASGHEQSSQGAREQTPRQRRTSPTDDVASPRNGVRSGLMV